MGQTFQPLLRAGSFALVSWGVASCGWIQPQQSTSQPPALFFQGSQTLAGSLQTGDTTSPRDGTWFDTYPVVVGQSQTLIAGLESSDFDAYVELLDPQGRVIAEDDDNGPDVNAFLAVTVLQPGSYALRVTTLTPKSGGAYRLSYELKTPVWTRQEIGTLGSGDTEHPEDKSWMDVYPIQGKARQILQIELTSPEFDPLIQVVNSAGEVIAQNDDQLKNLDPIQSVAPSPSSNSQLILYLEESGAYSLRVNSFSPGETGSYTLRYSLDSAPGQ